MCGCLGGLRACPPVGNASAPPAAFRALECTWDVLSPTCFLCGCPVGASWAPRGLLVGERGHGLCPTGASTRRRWQGREGRTHDCDVLSLHEKGHRP